MIFAPISNKSFNNVFIYDTQLYINKPGDSHTALMIGIKGIQKETKIR